MEKERNKKKQILETLAIKSGIKQVVYDKTLAVFSEIKSILEELVEEYNKELPVEDERIKLIYKERGQFEAEIKVAGDLLIFSMHTNTFEFDREHKVWKMDYVKENPLNSYCGMINVYNFLADSFKYNRLEDLGYLVARIFVNYENKFFVEGKRQLGVLYDQFGKKELQKDVLKEIIQTAVLYSLEFDLLVPPYDTIKIASVAQLNDKIEYSRMKTGKRLGFRFNSDDID